MRILILGGGVMQLPAVRVAKHKGWGVVVAAAEIIEEIQAIADRCDRVDLRDREAVTGLARAVKQKEGLDGVFTAGTDFSTTVAWVAEQVGLPGIPYASALAATDKSVMRSAFQSRGVPSPRFFSVQAESELSSTDLPRGMSFPLVVKPVDNMGARGVRRVDDEQQLRQAIEAAIGHSACERAIVEEFLEGPELSLDAVIYEAQVTICGVADRHICFPPYFVEMGHTLPSQLDHQMLRSSAEVFIRGIQALGIRQGAAKGDIKVTPEGPVIGEIAARLSGGYMSGWTFPFSSGIEVTAAALNVAVGLPPGDLTPKRNWVSAERAFISIPGVVKKVEGLERAREISGIQEIFLRVSPGQQVALPINNLGKCGNLIAAASIRSDALAAATAAVQRVFVRLEVDNPSTDAFLAGRAQGEFSAYPSPSPATLQALQAQPFWIGGPERFSGKVEDLNILALPEVAMESERDWHGWSLEGAFQRVMEITGVRTTAPAGSGSAALNDQSGSLTLGRVFWNAIIKGGIQAGVYIVDTLCNPAGKPNMAACKRWV